MHVHDLNPWRTLIALIAFVLLLVVGFITMHEPLMSYELDMKESLSTLNDSSNYFTPEELNAFLKQQPNDIVLIDIRDRFSFGQGHIPGAKNITAIELSEEENLDLMNAYKTAKTTVVLYGADQLEVNGPWMLGRQVGFDNIKILLGGYTYYQEQLNESANDQHKSYVKEVARYDYATVAKASDDDYSSSNNENKKPVIIKRKKKSSGASGGC